MIRATQGGHSVPHNFIKITATTPNPGRRTRDDVDKIVRGHHGELDGLWFDDKRQPHSAWVLVRGGDVDGMMNDLGGHQLMQLWLEGELEG
jgi:hypothetical protein